LLDTTLQSSQPIVASSAAAVGLLHGTTTGCSDDGGGGGGGGEGVMGMSVSQQPTQPLQLQPQPGAYQMLGLGPDMATQAQTAGSLDKYAHLQQVGGGMWTHSQQQLRDAAAAGGGDLPGTTQGKLSTLPAAEEDEEMIDLGF
jgi:hypothetical protein